MTKGLDNLISNERSTGYKGLLMNKLVKIWSGESYYIEDIGMEASVDIQHKKMHLPLKGKDWQDLRVLGQHESAHVLFTNTNSYKKLTKDLCEKYGTRTVWNIVNAFEDRRVEYLFSKIYAGAKGEFRDYGVEAVKDIFTKIDRLKPLDRLVFRINAYLVTGIKPKDKEIQVLAEEVKKEIESKWTQQSVVITSGKVLDFLAKKKREREEKDAEKGEGATDKEKKEKSSESVHSEKPPDISDLEELLDLAKDDTGENKEDSKRTKDDGKSEKGDSKHEDKEEEDTPEPNGDGKKDKDLDDTIEPEETKEEDDNYEDREDLETEEDVAGKKEKIEESRFKSKTKTKKSIEKAIKERKSIIMDGDKTEKKDPFKKLSKKSEPYIPVRKLITEEDIERNFTEIDKRRYDSIKNKNIGLIRRLRTNLMEIKNAVEIQESKGGIININRSINMVAQSGRPAFNRAVENINRNVSITFLLDQSGSMINSITEAKEALIILSEVLNGLQGFEFAMFGFCSRDNYNSGKSYHMMETFQYKGFSNMSTNLIASANTGSGNRDGYHIRVVKDYIQQHADVDAAKFLVVLSDGSPQDDNTEYIGRIALDDTMKAVQEVETQIPVIGVLFGRPSKEQQHLYKSRVHCVFGRLSEGLEGLVMNIQQQIVRG